MSSLKNFTKDIEIWIVKSVCDSFLNITFDYLDKINLALSDTEKDELKELFIKNCPEIKGSSSVSSDRSVSPKSRKKTDSPGESSKVSSSRTLSSKKDNVRRCTALIKTGPNEGQECGVALATGSTSCKRHSGEKRGSIEKNKKDGIDSNSNKESVESYLGLGETYPYLWINGNYVVCRSDPDKDFQKDHKGLPKKNTNEEIIYKYMIVGRVPRKYRTNEFLDGTLNNGEKPPLEKIDEETKTKMLKIEGYYYDEEIEREYLKMYTDIPKEDDVKKTEVIERKINNIIGRRTTENVKKEEEKDSTLKITEDNSKSNRNSSENTKEHSLRRRSKEENKENKETKENDIIKENENTTEENNNEKSKKEEDLTKSKDENTTIKKDEESSKFVETENSTPKPIKRLQGGITSGTENSPIKSRKRLSESTTLKTESAEVK